MDMYRLTIIIPDLLQRTVDLNLEQMQIATQEAHRAGFKVVCVLLPPDAELLPGILEEPTNLLMH